jgi:hypothetical protein
MMERPHEPAHRQFEDMAVSHVLGGLSSNEGRLFRSHLVECRSCRARVGELRAIAHDLADVERDERRSTERRQVDTKPVEIDVDEADDADSGPSRRWLMYVAGALVVLLGMVSWNYVLRGNNSYLETRVETLAQAALGTAWEITYPEESGAARAVVMEASSGDLTLLVEGVQGSTHQVFLYDAAGDEVSRHMLEPRDGAALGVIEGLPDDASRLVLKRSAADTSAASGPTVLEAARP